MAERVLLLSPYTAKSRQAEEDILRPDPQTDIVGYNLWKMMEARTGITEQEYMTLFRRRALMVGRWSSPTATIKWRRQEESILRSCDLVVLVGESLRRAAGLSAYLPLLSLRGGIATMPLPTRNAPFYAHPGFKAAAEVLLEEIYLRATA